MTSLPDITVFTTKHKYQAYDTAGDYGENFDGWWVSISKTEDWRHEALVMVHELVEMLLTKNNGVDWKDIDAFDISGPGAEMNDPGASPEAPYHKEHVQAEEIEKRLAEMLGVNWDEYNKVLDSLEYR